MFPQKRSGGVVHDAVDTLADFRTGYPSARVGLYVCCDLIGSTLRGVLGAVVAVPTAAIIQVAAGAFAAHPDEPDDVGGLPARNAAQESE